MVAVIVAIAGAVTWSLARTQPRSVEIILPAPGPVVVHVTGSVVNPGVYTLPPGSRIQEAVEAAGGLSGPATVNLAAPVRDGQQIVVSTLPTSQSTGLDDSGISVPVLLLDLNTASGAQLEQLPGIGPARASSIIEFRERNGPILFADDLTAIDGIGPATVDGLRQLVVQP
jgi:competence protein ComEA